MRKKVFFNNFGLLNPNISLVFAYVYSVASFRVARHDNLATDDNPGNTEAMSKKQMPYSDSAAQNFYINEFSLAYLS